MAQTNETKSTADTLTVEKNLSVEGDLSVTGTISGNLSGNATSATKATQDGNGNNIVDTYATKSEISTAVGGDYLPLSGGTLTGPLTTVSQRNTGNYGLNLVNSDIIGVNGIYMANPSNASDEGISWYRDGSNWDRLYSYNGTLYYLPNDPLASVAAENGNTVWHSGNLNVRTHALGTYNGSGTYYYKLAWLPVYNDSGNFPNILLYGRIGGWESVQSRLISLNIGNRNTVSVNGVCTGADPYNKVDVVIYKNSDSTHSVYLKVASYFAFSLVMSCFHLAQDVYDGTYSETAPDGTLEWSLQANAASLTPLTSSGYDSSTGTLTINV